MNQLTQSELVDALATFTDAQIAGELLRRAEERKHREATIKALEHMQAHPVQIRRGKVHTVTDIAIWCDEHNVNATAGYAAFEQLHPEYSNWTGGTDA